MPALIAINHRSQSIKALAKVGSIGLLALAVLTVAPRSSARAADADQSARASVLMTGMRNTLDKLKTGEYLAEGRREVKSKDNPERDKTIKLEVYSAFDFTADKYRLDVTETPLTIHEEGRYRPVQFSYMRVPKEAAIWSPQGPRFRHGRGGFSDGQVTVNSSLPFPNGFPEIDVRTMALKYSLYQPERPPLTYETLLGVFHTKAERTVTKEANDVECIHFKYPDNPEECSLWINTAQGNTPFRLLVQVPGKEPRVLSEVVWKQINEVWVPISYRHDEPHYGIQFSLAFEWASVNKPIRDEVFSWKSLNIPRKTPVYGPSVNGKAVLLNVEDK